MTRRKRKSNMNALEAAREALAAKYRQTYTKNAILRGEWDRGELIQNELDRLAQVTVEEESDEG